MLPKYLTTEQLGVYGSTNPSTLKILESNVHNAGARIATGAYCTSPVTTILCEANLPPLEIRRKQLSLPYAASRNTQHRQILL